jgi:hypothetical protein
MTRAPDALEPASMSTCYPRPGNQREPAVKRCSRSAQLVIKILKQTIWKNEMFLYDDARHGIHRWYRIWSSEFEKRSSPRFHCCRFRLAQHKYESLGSSGESFTTVDRLQLWNDARGKWLSDLLISGAPAAPL